MRYLPGVIDEILDEIPESEAELRTELAMLRARLRYVAPEAMGMYWLAGAAILSKRAQDPKQQWTRNIHAIWNYPERN